MGLNCLGTISCAVNETIRIQIVSVKHCYITISMLLIRQLLMAKFAAWRFVSAPTLSEVDNVWGRRHLRGATWAAT